MFHMQLKLRISFIECYSFLIVMKLTYNIVLVQGKQQTDSIIFIFSDYFPLYDIEYSSLCYMVETCSVLHVCVLVAQSCPTLCDPMGCDPPVSFVHGSLQARMLEWVVIPYPRDLPDPG